MNREPYLPPRKSVNERIEDLKKKRVEIDRKIRMLESLEQEAYIDTMKSWSATADPHKKPYWMKSGRHG